jgi:hypothetical protein
MTNERTDERGDLEQLGVHLDMTHGADPCPTRSA